jgi:hypothetical protein
MTQVTKGFASDPGTRLLNLELRRLEEDPQAATTSYVHIIRTMHTELVHLSTENLELKGELDASKKSVCKLSQQLAEGEDLQAAKENERTWALAAARMLRAKLKMAQRNIRQRQDHNEQLHKYAINHRAEVTFDASSGTEHT